MQDEQRTPLATVKDLILLGEALPFHVMDELGRRLLAEGQRIVSETQLEMLLARGAWAHTHEVQALKDKYKSQAPPRPTLLRKESLFDIWEKKIWELDAVLRKVLAGQVCAAEVNALALRLAHLISRDTDVALFMTVRQNEPRYALYALLHALHTATIGMVLSRQLGWPVGQTASLLCASLTMNVSTLELQARMAQQQDPPSSKQMDQIRAHPQASEELLRAAGVQDEAWLAAVREHHERPDGTGYPGALTDITELAHALRVTDVFTAKISPRAFRPAMNLQAAAKQLFQDERGGPMAAGLIKALGLYPPGDMVDLKSGEVGVVVRRGPSATMPKVATLTNRQGKPVVETFVRDTSDPQFAVQGPHTERQGLTRVMPERVYGYIFA